ncbi:curved DNA-binding protein [Thiothrix eikelboomii]|uniref:Curved DNA-binding protein n=1 Tax=Thiothrix eikelboomii TaxID=92487 RepID=A0A1T4VXV9_9GAMM|nr:DnaJ C-terminal domain-containing protein [Thiothrix eikelboomii]SKA69648.1 curved DNA-binding protein [Thiothrix eikelboomii]
MAAKDYYQVLGILPSASADDIKLAYRRLARKYHPDVSHLPGAEEQFKAVNEAYETLSDSSKRRQYEQQQTRPKPTPTDTPKTSTQPPPAQASRVDVDTAFFEEISQPEIPDTRRSSAIFNSLFGKKRREKTVERKVQPPLEPQEYHLTLQIEDVFFDTIKAIQAPNGDTIQVRVPKGSSAGSRLRLQGKGVGGADLSLVIHLAEHPYYQLIGQDLYLDLPISPWEAALGAHILAPTPTGAVSLKIPPDSESGKKMRLAGRGINTSTTQGDMYITLQVHTPPATTAQHQEFYAQMERTFNWSPRQHLKTTR